jgi:hypothetical protein
MPQSADGVPEIVQHEVSWCTRLSTGEAAMLSIR